MRVLLIGSGGREHALGWALTRSGRLSELVALPGNPGLAGLGPVVEGVDPADPAAVPAVARKRSVDLVVVGPEAPLAAGVADALAGAGIPVFGPTRSAARLESSKSFAKEVMRRAGVPTAAARVFGDRGAAKAHLAAAEGPFVVKADGLAAGKGVLVTEDRRAALDWVDRCFDGAFGEAGATVVIEEHMEGEELSVFALCNGERAVALEPARDSKRLLDGDLGPNTGGMGSYSPVALPSGLVESVLRGVIEPTLSVMADDGSPYTGFLYAGLCLTAAGPKVMEFNCRLGDPETQVVLPRLDTDLLEMIEKVLAGGTVAPSWASTAAVNVVLAAAGYPGTPRTGDPISGLDRVPEEVLVFHAGTTRSDGEVVTAGGRVLNLVGVGDTLSEARERAYQAAGIVSFEGMQYRRDIAAR